MKYWGIDIENAAGKLGIFAIKNAAFEVVCTALNYSIFTLNCKAENARKIEILRAFSENANRVILRLKTIVTFALFFYSLGGSMNCTTAVA